MHFLPFFAAIGFLVQAFSPALASAEGITRLDSFRKRDVATTLGSKLSANATIILPSDPDWTNVTARWTQYLAPSFSVVVEPATEADIVAAVCFNYLESVKYSNSIVGELCCRRQHELPHRVGNAWV